LRQVGLGSDQRTPTVHHALGLLTKQIRVFPQNARILFAPPDRLLQEA
jgi:hypothetical protein